LDPLDLDVPEVRLALGVDIEIVDPHGAPPRGSGPRSGIFAEAAPTSPLRPSGWTAPAAIMLPWTDAAPEEPVPLTGIRGVDLTRVVSGPYCSMFLADMGADIVKVEAPEGDGVRRQGAMRDGLSWYFAAFNRNKRSITLDLRTDDGRAVLAKMIERADVLVDN